MVFDFKGIFKEVCFLLDTFDMLHFVNLKCRACYFDIFVYCNMTATETVFITLQDNTVVYIHYTRR